MEGCEKPFMWPQEESSEASLCGGKSRQRQGSSLLEALDKVSLLGAGSWALKQTKPRVWLCSFGFAFSGNVLLYQAVLEASKIVVCKRTLEQIVERFLCQIQSAEEGPSYHQCLQFITSLRDAV